MILPSGINKMTGLGAALEELQLSPHNVVGIGDAENDHAFLESCECAAAVANAIPALKGKADLITEGARGAGVPGARIALQALAVHFPIANGTGTTGGDRC